MANTDFPKAFKLAKAGDSANVRFLHSSKDTIEVVKTHWVQKGDTWKHFKCLGENCPACEYGNAARERAYIRLFNYDTNEVEVWDRTNNKKFMDSLAQISDDWGGLNATAMKIFRESDEFPTYTVTSLPPNKYPPTSVAIDEKIAYRMVGSRSAEDIKEFLATGVMPQKKQRTETNQADTKPKDNTSGLKQSGDTITVNNKPSFGAPIEPSFADIDDEDLPF